MGDKFEYFLVGEGPDQPILDSGWADDFAEIDAIKNSLPLQTQDGQAVGVRWDVYRHSEAGEYFVR